MTINKLAGISMSQVQAIEEVVWPGTSLYHWFPVPAIEEVADREPVKTAEVPSPTMAPKRKFPDSAYPACLFGKRTPPSAQAGASQPAEAHMAPTRQSAHSTLPVITFPHVYPGEFGDDAMEIADSNNNNYRIPENGQSTASTACQKETCHLSTLH